MKNRLLLLPISFLLLMPGIKEPLSVKAESSVIDEAFNPENFLNPDNYKADITPVLTENGLKVSGATTYQLPFTFDRGYSHKIKFKFSIDEMAVNDTAFLMFSPNPNIGFPGVGMDAPGVYFRITNHGENYHLDGFYTDGINYNHEALTLNSFYPGSAARDHTFQFETSLVTGYVDGVKTFYQGSQFADWLCYSMVKNNIITDENSKIYISTYGDLRITNILPGDTEGPKIEYEEPEEPAYAGDEYTFGTIRSIDKIDGELPWTYKLYDPTGKEITNKITETEDGHLKFKPLRIGEYTLRILSSDYSTNNAAKRILLNVRRHEHYPVFDEDYVFPKDARVSSKYLIPKVSAHDIDEGEADNEIIYRYGAHYFSNSGSRREVNLLQEEDGTYYFIPKNEKAYLSDGLGKFFITVEAENRYGVSTLEREIYVKPDIVGEESMKNENLFDSKNWSSSSYSNFGADSLTVAGPTHYKAGLSIDKGVILTFSVEQLIDKSTIDNWFSFGLSAHPGPGKYGSSAQGLFFMFFYQNGAFRYNMQYVTNEGVHIDIKNNEPLAADFGGETTLAVYPFDVEKDPSMYDNIDVSLNGGKVDSFEIYKVSRSEMADDEGFVYLNYGYNNMDEKTSFDPELSTNNPIVKIKRLRIEDRIGPIITLKGEIPSSAKVGDVLLFPEATAVDETDGDVEAYLSSIVDEDGVGMTVINNKATFQKPGIYTVRYRAVDLSGNIGTLERTIEIKGNGSSSGCQSSLEPGIGMISAALAGACFFVFLRKKEKKHP